MALAQVCRDEEEEEEEERELREGLERAEEQ